MAYPPLTGRLHTRYSPVRRSPPQYCYLVLPLDLHVLSLSLAFILSQDQTLRCQFVCFYIVAQNNLFIVSSKLTVLFLFSTRYKSNLYRFLYYLLIM